MDGHYSRAQWQAFADGKAAEQAQMLEHLTVCEACMEQYTEVVQLSVSIAPPRGMTEEILSRVAPQRTVVAILPQMMKVVLSAALAVAVWIGSSALITPDTASQAAQARVEQQIARMDRQIQKQRQRAEQPKPAYWDLKALLTGKINY